jgi:hypothetical protein
MLTGVIRCVLWANRPIRGSFGGGEQGLEMPVQRLNLPGQDIVAGLLAEEHEELTNGIAYQAPLRTCVSWSGF